MDPCTTIPELFAIIRQWVPQVQHKIDIIGEEVRDSPCALHTIVIVNKTTGLNTLKCKYAGRFDSIL